MNKKLEINDRIRGLMQLEVEIGAYLYSDRMYIGLLDENGEHFMDMTVNIDGICPDYCGYVNINNWPEMADFIERHKLGEFTGIMGKSGFCQYPLYLFYPKRLREVAPESMELFERTIMGTGQEKIEIKDSRGGREK